MPTRLTIFIIRNNNPSAATMLRHHPGLSCGAAPQGRLRSESPPCAKGDVFAYAKTGGLFPLCSPSVSCADTSPSLRRGGIKLKWPTWRRVAGQLRTGEGVRVDKVPLWGAAQQLRGHTGETVQEKAPLCKGGCLRFCGDWGIDLFYNPSLTPPRDLLRKSSTREALLGNPKILLDETSSDSYYSSPDIRAICNSNQKVLPSPFLLETPKGALCSTRAFFTMESPKPVPATPRL